MTEKLKALYNNYKDLIVYILVGGITTVAAWSSKFFCGAILYPGLRFPSVRQTTVLNAVENLSGILAAYFPNRWWVFHSKDPRIFPEFLRHFASRLITWGLSYLLNLLTANVLRIEYHFATVLVSAVVVLANYTISKFLVFRKNRARAERGNREEEGEHEEV